MKKSGFLKREYVMLLNSIEIELKLNLKTKNNIKLNQNLNIKKERLMKTNQKRFFTKGTILGYKGGIRSQKPSQILLKIINSKEHLKLEPFLGKKVLYQTKTKTKKRKVFWGKIVSLHGRSGVFIARFSKPLPPCSFSSYVYVTPLPFRK